MTGQQVELFSTRLTAEMNALTRQERDDIIMKIGRMELRMRATGQNRPLWRGPETEDKILGKTVVVQTEQGERRGRVICFGITQCPDSIEYERSLVVFVPSSGTHHEAPSSMSRLASTDDFQRIQDELEMSRRLSSVDTTRPEGPTPLPTATKSKRRGEKDPALLQRMLEAAQKSAKVKVIEEGGANHKIVGMDPSKRIYLFKSQLRVDISGFSVDHPGIRSISDAEAKDMHLGKVRGQLIFDDKVAAYDGFVKALEMMA